MAKIMLFLTGNAEGFRVSERTICHRCNISESGYKKARKKLVEKQWIFHKAGGYIQVNFNKIYSDFRVLEAGCSQDDPQETEEKVDVGAFKILSNPSEGSSVQTTGNTEKTEGGFPQNTYNNINNIIKNNIENISDKGSCCEDTRSEVAYATSPQASSQPLREIHLSREEKKKIENDFTSWLSTKLKWIEVAYDLEDSAELRRMVESDEYKEVLKEADERRAVLKKEFGDDLQI